MTHMCTCVSCVSHVSHAHNSSQEKYNLTRISSSRRSHILTRIISSHQTKFLTRIVRPLWFLVKKSKIWLELRSGSSSQENENLTWVVRRGIIQNWLRQEMHFAPASICGPASYKIGCGKKCISRPHIARPAGGLTIIYHGEKNMRPIH